jgi:hypothetical protein
LDEEPSPDNGQSQPVVVGPDGTPLGRAFLIPASPLADELRAVVRAVASVHGDGPLPTIPIRIVRDPEIRHARFRHGPAGPISISVNLDSPWRAFALAHEIGHFNDYAAFGASASYASESEPRISTWRRTIRRSGRPDEVRRALAERTALLTPEQIRTGADLQTMPEWWARSYAQYIAIRSDEPTLLGTLDAVRAPRSREDVDHLLHWDEGGFAPIADAIETLFRRLGWRSAR